MNLKEVKVRCFISPNSLKPVANQFVIATEKGNFFQSYGTTIAFVSRRGRVVLDREKWCCSPTTSKYRNIFLGESTEDTKRKIKEHKYRLTNLN